jgi:hypothetical protein
MKIVSQAIARLSILCYLVVASIAAAHAFPMPSAAASKSAAATKDAITVMHIGSGDSQALGLEVAASMGDMQSDCHQSKSSSSDASMMSACKIFCSATSHALTTDIFVDQVLMVPPVQVASVSEYFQTRQYGVEQHPPK